MEFCLQCRHEWKTRWGDHRPQTCPRCRSRCWDRADKRRQNRGSMQRNRPTLHGWEKMRVGEIKYIPTPGAIMSGEQMRFVARVQASRHRFNWLKKTRIIARDADGKNLIFERLKNVTG